MSDAVRDRIVNALSSGESPLRDEGVRLIIDQLLGVPVRDLVDFEEVRGIVIASLTSENVGRVVSRHVAPGFERYGTLVAESGETLGGLVPEDAVDRIQAIVEKAKPPHAKWAEGIVDPALVRRLFAPVWTHLLVNFAKRMPIPGMGGGGGTAGAASAAAGRGISSIAGRLSKSVQERAEKIADASRNVMGGLGAELEKRIQSAARDFGESAQSVFRDALRDRLKSAEGRELVSQMKRQVVEHLLMTKLSALHEDVAHFPVKDVFAVVPDVLAHAVRRPFIEKIVTGEIQAFLEQDGDKSLRDLLTELGALEQVRKLLMERGSDLLRRTAESAEFRTWIGKLIE